MDQRPKTAESATLNPLELSIFFAILGVFAFSTYRFLSDTPTLTALPETRAPGSISDPSQGATSGTAKITGQFSSFGLKCGALDPESLSLHSSKIRITGELCGSNSESPTYGSKPKTSRAYVVNQTNRYTATVFVDGPRGKFSTDYIPLEAGSNQIVIKFVAPSGKISEKSLTITKN